MSGYVLQRIALVEWAFCAYGPLVMFGTSSGRMIEIEPVDFPPPPKAASTVTVAEDAEEVMDELFATAVDTTGWITIRDDFHRPKKQRVGQGIEPAISWL